MISTTRLFQAVSALSNDVFVNNEQIYPVQEGGDSCPHCVAPVFQQKRHNHDFTITYV